MQVQDVINSLSASYKIGSNNIVNLLGISKNEKKKLSDWPIVSTCYTESKQLYFYRFARPAAYLLGFYVIRHKYAIGNTG